MSEQHAKINKVEATGAVITVTIDLPTNLLEASANAFDSYIRSFFEAFKADFIDEAYKTRHRYAAGEFDS